MAFLTGGANTLSAAGYDVDNSCRFNSADSPQMVKAIGTPTSTKICTISFWFKRGIIGAEQHMFGNKKDGNERSSIGLDDDGYTGALNFLQEDSGSYAYQFRTNRLFRDPSAWYHLVLAIDTNQGTESNRLKFYINGTQETSFAVSTYPAEDLAIRYGNDGEEFSIGTKFGGGGSYGNFFDGYLAEVVFIDGQQLTPTSFGEFDSDSPTIWKPIDVSGLTFGNNGFYLDFEDSGNLGDDESGNTDDFTESNLAATDQATDTPTNNFATLNPLNYSSVSKTYAEGNTALTASNGDDWNATQSNFSVRNGKWYWEVKVTAIGNFAAIGVGFNPFNSNATAWLQSTYLVGEQTGSYGWRNNGARPQGGGALSTYTTNDILSIAMDMDNQKVYFAKNGTWEDSGDPTSGATGTGSIGNLTANKDYLIVICPRGSAMYCNFGNPAFTISSSNADADGYGNFEYAVPSGYFALCTKNLAEYG